MPNSQAAAVAAPSEEEEGNSSSGSSIGRPDSKLKLMHEIGSPQGDSSPSSSQDKLEVPQEEGNWDASGCCDKLDTSIEEEEIKNSYPESTANKYNSRYHKLFKDIPSAESLMKVYSCAWQKDILIQGRLYISRHWLCFHANLFGKNIKVTIPMLSVQSVKKHKTAGLVPNGLAILTSDSEKYVFVSLMSRDNVYDILKNICTHLQAVNKKSLSVKDCTDDGHAIFLEELLPEVPRRRRNVPVPTLSLSLPDTEGEHILVNSPTGLSPVESSFPADEIDQVLNSTSSLYLNGPVKADECLQADSTLHLGGTEYQLLKVFIVLILFLIVSSCYLAFRVSSLEQQLSSLNSDNYLPGFAR
ncbi:GRAM domain-containing protein 2A isoform X2 [Protopterus annectens]|uniref:GRAM domain-containing protein 2A isoform X2 n=1 Tax=Protopterus annectens TaxID=7888 RepID=UPI001CFB393B|nr:GRAM domain-containing protein 2A isoform X2 [Protopterus annectens]